MNKRSALSTVSRPALALCVLTLAGLVATAQSTADISGRLSNNTSLTYTITPGVTQAQKVAVKKAFVAALPDLAGTWGSNIGLTYTITQSGTQCTWTDSNGVPGTITLAASGLMTNWTDAGGPHSATGVITESDATGRPTKIEWSIGVVFLRQPEPLKDSQRAGEMSVVATVTAPTGAKVKRARADTRPDLAGTWGSNIGLTYTITQSGTQCTWTDTNGVTGAITLTASGLTTNWTDAGGPQSATGIITESDATGRPRTISWNNGVVFQRASVTEAALTPIQLPAPQGPPASWAADYWSQFSNSPPLSSLLLAQVAAPVTRRSMIETLSAFPETRAALEQVATSAGTTVSLLTVQMLSGSKAFDAPLLLSSPPAPTLLDLWKTPVHFSPVLPGPVYQSGGSTHIVGNTEVKGIYCNSVGALLQTMVQKDYFHLFGTARILIELPPGGGQYMLTVQVVDSNGTAIGSDNKPVARASFSTPFSPTNSMSDTIQVPLVKNSTNTALVGIFSDKPTNMGWPGGAGKMYLIENMANVSIDLHITMEKYGVYAGVTISRL